MQGKKHAKIKQKFVFEKSFNRFLVDKTNWVVTLRNTVFSSVLKDFFPNSNIFARRVSYFPTVCGQGYADFQEGFFLDIWQKL